MSKKVLFISPQPFFQWRGSPIRVGFDLMALVKNGYKVDFLTLPVGEDKPIDGVRIVRVWNIFFVRNMPIGPSLIKAAFDVLLLFVGLGMAIKNRYDVVHGVEDAGFLGVIIAGVVRCKLVYEKHSDPGSYKKKSIMRNMVMKAYAAVEKFTAKHADAVIATGTGLAEQVQKMNVCQNVFDIFDIPSSLVEADADRVKELKAELKQNEDDVLITYVGSFAVYQGVDMMFSAVAKVLAENEKALVLIIGGNKGEIAERRECLAELGVAERVIFAGKIPPDELPAYLAASDILLSPRQAGVNTPLKILDYFKAGGAVVATDIPANRLLVDESTAVLTAIDDVSFAKGIVTLIDDANLRNKIATAGHEMYRGKYNFSEFSRMIGECYLTVVSSQ
ncbi:MAG: glycosyltransferase [Kiritimatiellae bacterium]|nr:glycosyltransferase [Kiritimatiellia bacterium]